MLALVSLDSLDDDLGGGLLLSIARLRLSGFGLFLGGIFGRAFLGGYGEGGKVCIQSV